MRVVIMAGGKGTRMLSVNAEVPKPMLFIMGKPVLEYQLEILRRQNVEEVTVVIGHLGNVIQEHFGDGSLISPSTGLPFGIKIHYIVEETPLGTAGALYYLRKDICEDVLLINGDVIFDLDIHRFYKFHKKYKGQATILTHPNDHPYDSGVIETKEHCVISWSNKEESRSWYKNRVNAGIHILSSQVISKFEQLKKTDLDREILRPLIKIRSLYAYDSSEYIKDMGTPKRYEEVEEDVKNSKPKKGISNGNKRQSFWIGMEQLTSIRGF